MFLYYKGAGRSKHIGNGIGKGNGKRNLSSNHLNNGYIVSLECQTYCFLVYLFKSKKRMSTFQIHARALMHTFSIQGCHFRRRYYMPLEQMYLVTRHYNVNAEIIGNFDFLVKGYCTVGN